MGKNRREIPLSRTDADGHGEAIAPRCEHPDCGDAGAYRAPRSRYDAENYYWFCLDHVRQYNAAWNYFEGMSQQEIERFQRDVATWHRPTWPLGGGAAQAWAEGRVHDPLGMFGAAGATSGTEEAANARLTSRQRRALAQLDLNATVSLQELKMRYKQLVKRYHPDANGGDKAAEERFKLISEAYSYLLSSGFA